MGGYILGRDVYTLISKHCKHVKAPKVFVHTGTHSRVIVGHLVASYLGFPQNMVLESLFTRLASQLRGKPYVPTL